MGSFLDGPGNLSYHIAKKLPKTTRDMLKDLKRQLEEACSGPKRYSLSLNNNNPLY